MGRGDYQRCEPNQSLGWKTESASPIQHAGIVKFKPNSDGSTRIDIKMSYNPVAGALGHAVAAIFCADPRTEMDQDLARMKTMIETGRPPHDGRAEMNRLIQIKRPPR